MWTPGRISPGVRLRLGCALEALFGAGAADDLLALAEPEPRLLVAKRLPKVVELRVDLLDLRRDRRVEPLGEKMPELLALLRELLDLGMNLSGGHAALKRVAARVHSPAEDPLKPQP